MFTAFLDVQEVVVAAWAEMETTPVAAGLEARADQRLEQAAGARDAEARAGQLDADLRQRTAELARERARADSRAERIRAWTGFM